MAVRDVVQAAAGVGGGETTYVEDVFSTHLYTGNGSTQFIENGIALGDTNAGPCVPFNGSQYLSRTSDLTGNSDGSTFTLSFWAFVTNTYSTIFKSNSGRVEVLITSNRVQFDFKNTSGTSIWRGNSASNTALNYQWNHILISVDAGSAAQIYINDVSSAISYVSNTSGTFDFTDTSWGIGAPAGGGYQPIQGKLTEFFFDKTYRNLGIEANRRLFITADGEPATGLASLNPLIYLPLNDTVSVGTNEGTGGDFVPINGLSSSETGGPYTEAGYGQGGMVWIKSRSNVAGHSIFDTSRGAGHLLRSNSSGADNYTADTQKTLTAFNSNGFSLGTDSGNWGANFNNYTYASWTFRKAPKFFDVVTYTGDGVAGRTVAHNLGSVPGCMIVKKTNGAADWNVYHRGINVNGDNAPETDLIYLNLTVAAFDYSIAWNDTAPTSTEFTLGSQGDVNASGSTYVAYLFAHDAGGFGDDGEQNVISCGSYTGTGSSASGSAPIINLGWEPQWLLIKRTGPLGTGDWVMLDNMRGINPTPTDDRFLLANSTDEEAGNNYADINATGFEVRSTNGNVNDNGYSYIYIAIRRPMKTPESGTEVFAMDTMSNTDPSFTAGFPVDMSFHKQTTAGPNWAIASRLTGKGVMYTDLTEAENTESANVWDFMDGWHNYPSTVSNWYAWMFKRAPGFFDVVCYTGGTGTPRVLNHNLAVPPELVITKVRNYTLEDWVVHYNNGSSIIGGYLNNTSAFANSSTAPSTDITSLTSTTYTLNTSNRRVNAAYNYVAYLFATLDGVSKVGSYTGTGTGDGDTLNIDCGFSNGARFVLIKRTDTSGNWTVYDTARGINASADDKRLELNGTGAEDTNENTIEPLASGFTVRWDTDSSASNNPNVNNATYIFLAIA